MMRSCMTVLLFPMIVMAQSFRVHVAGEDSRSATDSIVVKFRVVDREGLPIEVLPYDAVAVWDNGMEIPEFRFDEVDVIPDKNHYIVLVIDVSGSMRYVGSLNRIKYAATGLVDALVPGEYCAVVAYSTGVHLVSGFTDDRNFLKDRITGLEAGGYTSVYDGIFEALRQLSNQQAASKKSLLLLTDGDIEGRSMFTLADITPRIYATNNLRVHTFVLRPVTGVHELHKLAGIGNGSFVASSRNKNVVEAIRQFPAKDRRHFRVAFPPASRPASGEHTVTLVVNVDGIEQRVLRDVTLVQPVAENKVPPPFMYIAGGAILAMGGLAGAFIAARRKRHVPSNGPADDSQDPAWRDLQRLVEVTTSRDGDEHTRTISDLEPQDDEKTVILERRSFSPPALGYLTLKDAQGQTRTVAIESSEMLFGRSEQCHVHCPDTEISRLHAKLRREGEEFVLYDLGSANGTFVNGEEIQKRPVKNGDTISIGKYVLTLSSAPSPEPALNGR